MAHSPANPIVWFEIPVTDLEAAKTFYATITGMTLTTSEDGPNPMAFFEAADNSKAVRGHLYPGKPASHGNGPTVHLAAAEPLDDLRDKVTKAGGTVVSPNIDLPMGAFFYLLDLDGNSVGLFRLN